MSIGATSTLSVRSLLRAARRAERRDPWRSAATPAPAYGRPRTRADCLGDAGTRPCPFVACKYHLFLTPRENGAVKFNWGPDLDILGTMPETCALDVAARGPHQLEAVADLLNVTRERIRQEEMVALKKLKAYCRTNNMDPGTLVMAETAYDEVPQKETPMLHVADEAKQEEAVSESKVEMAKRLLSEGNSNAQIVEAVKAVHGRGIGPNVLSALRRDMGLPGRRDRSPQAAAGPDAAPRAAEAPPVAPRQPRGSGAPAPSSLRGCLEALRDIMRRDGISQLTLDATGTVQIQRTERLSLG